MKKILLTMIGICLIMGMQAQTTKRLREYRNPQIDGLMKYAKSMGVDVWEFYSRNYRSMSFHVSEYNDSDPHDNPALLIDSIKSTPQRFSPINIYLTNGRTFGKVNVSASEVPTCTISSIQTASIERLSRWRWTN